MKEITELNWGAIEIIYLIIIAAVGFLLTLLVIPRIITFMKKKGYVGYDIHKNARPEVAESGGLSIVIGFTGASILMMLFFPIFLNEIIIVLFTVVLAGIIGFIDDRIRLRSRYKILLTIFTGGAIFLAHYLGFIEVVSPTIPFLGRTRLTILYPLAAPIIVAVFCNATNMLEGYNGEGSGTCLIAACSILICSIIWNSAEGLILSIVVIAVLIPFFLYNKFPAKIFPGDIGTLSMGAMIACIALFGSLEVAVFCAFLIHIFNSFYVLSSVRGFFESSELLENKSDIILLEDDRIKASDNKKSAMSLPRLILAKGPLSEADLVKNFLIISVICGFFAVVASLFMSYTTGMMDVLPIVITTILLIIPTGYLMFKFKPIRGVVTLMILLLVAGIFVLIIADLYIMNFIDGSITIPIINANLPYNIIAVALIVAPGLVIWYIITIKFFWYEINKMKKLENTI